MLGVNFSNKVQKKAFIVGAVVSLVVGLVIPDKWNPYEILKSKFGGGGFIGPTL